MVKIAVAGGTSPTLGRRIVEALLASDSKHEVVILSRKGGSKWGARVVAADYSDQKGLAGLLEREQIHTIISVIRLDDLTAMLDVHRTLLDAAHTAAVSRLIFSDWGMGPLSANAIEILAHKNEMHQMGETAMAKAKAANTHVVECSSIQNGLFMEYLIVGSEGCWFDDPFMLDYIDVKNGKLFLPCQENGQPSRSTVTSIKDIGRFVAAAMDLPPGKLVGRIGLSGQELPSYQYVADILKKDCGREVKLQKLTARDCDRIADEANHKVQQAAHKGDFDVPAFIARETAGMVKLTCEAQTDGGIVVGKLNALCPQVKPTQVEEMLVAAWGKAP